MLGTDDLTVFVSPLDGVIHIFIERALAETMDQADTPELAGWDRIIEAVNTDGHPVWDSIEQGRDYIIEFN